MTKEQNEIEVKKVLREIRIKKNISIIKSILIIFTVIIMFLSISTHFTETLIFGVILMLILAFFGGS